MKLVVDANILFSAFIKDSITAKLLLEKDLELYTPDFMFDEFKKYEKLILEKTSRPKEKFMEILDIVNIIINAIDYKEYSNFLNKAKTISPDKKDVIYFALALKLKCGIWSNDKKLKEQNKIKVYSTGEIIKILRNKKQKNL